MLYALVQIGNNGARVVLRGRLSTQILGANFAILEHLVDRILDKLAVGWQIDVTQQFSTAQQHGRWVGNILAHGLGEGVTCSLNKI